MARRALTSPESHPYNEAPFFVPGSKRKCASTLMKSRRPDSERAWDVPREQHRRDGAGDRPGYRAARAVRTSTRSSSGSTAASARGACEGASSPRRAAAVSGRSRWTCPLDFELIVRAPGAEYGGAAATTRGSRSPGREPRGASTPRTRTRRRTPARSSTSIRCSASSSLLALPGYPVCQEGCKGLCSVCGANLNERDCGCDRHVPDPRWAGLEN